MTSRPLSRHSLSSRRGGYSPSSNHNIFRILSIQISLLSCTCFVGLAFYLGAIFGAGLVGSDNPVSISTDLHRDACPKCDGLDQSKIDQVVEQRVTEKMASIPENNEKVAANAETDFNSVAFPRSMSRFVHGMASANTDEFIDLMDYGYPHDHHKGDGRDEVLVFYVNDRAKPDGVPKTAKDAVKNCEVVSVVTLEASEGKDTCLAVMGGYESFHLQRWMRNGDPENNNNHKTKDLQKQYALRHVSRGMKRNGVDDFHPPKLNQIHQHWGTLKRYMDNYDEVSSQLKNICKKIAKNNTIIVMVCNMGQASLLMNFACSARSRGLNIDNVLVFVTDEQTLKLAQGLGLNYFYDHWNFGELPLEEAKRYGDRTFVAMMYAKVVCVQMVNMLGYDVLFQDVDIVWYENPLETFWNPESKLVDYDILFQDDGARSLRYAPYSANSGFYYVRHNARTRYLFTSLLYSSDLILALHSHQQVLTAFLTEHSSLYGLKVKTLDGPSFPGGYHYHRSKKLMQDIVSDKHHAALFHMSWTNNKDNKLLFFKQMGMWYLNEQCEATADLVLDGNMVDNCCSVEPIVTCHYRDKPSIIPCKDSPPIDKGRPSFW